MKNSIALFLIFLSSFLAGDLMAQDENSCGYQPDPAYIRLMKSPTSAFNKRLVELKKFPLNQVIKAKSFKKINGQFKLNLPKSGGIQNDNNGEGDEGELFSGVGIRIIPVVAHIVRRSDRSGGLTTAQLNASIQRANNHYRSANLRFQLCQTKYIDSNSLYSFSFNSNSDNAGTSDASYTKLSVTSRNVARKLNIYFVPSSNTSWAWRPNLDNRTQHIMMVNRHATNESTLSHEIGHFFSLLHTHDSSSGAELVNGSNCSNSGDLVCDTPADPNLSNRVNSSCNYVGSLRDANGVAYSPDPSNMMSYSTKPCRNRFSNGQIYLMQSAYLGMDEDRGYTFQFCPTAPPQPTVLNVGGYYKCNDGGHYYIRKIGTKIFWFGEHPNGSWANVFKGKMTSSGKISGSFYDVPKGRVTGKGTLSLIASNRGRTIRKTSGRFGGTVWTKTTRPSRLPSNRRAGFNSNGKMNDLDGLWSCNDGGKYYVREINGVVAWFGEGGLNSRGIPKFANVGIGRRSGNTFTMDWADVPKCGLSGKGTLKLKVKNANEFVKTSGSRFGGSKWTRQKKSAGTVIARPTLMGRWTNVDKKTKGVTKFTVSNNSKTINPYGSCSPKDCNWGKKTLRRSGSTYKVTYDSGASRKYVTIKLNSANRATMTVKYDFKDKRRKDKTETYSFKK